MKPTPKTFIKKVITQNKEFVVRACANKAALAFAIGSIEYIQNTLKAAASFAPIDVYSWAREAVGWTSDDFTPTVTGAEVNLTGLDDDARIYVNDSLVYSGSTHGPSKSVNTNISVNVGDVVTVYVWDGWGYNWGIDSASLTVRYSDGSSNTLTIGGAMRGKSSSSCSGDAEKCRWPDGTYWKTPQIDDTYMVGQVTIPAPSSGLPDEKLCQAIPFLLVRNARTVWDNSNIYDNQGRLLGNCSWFGRTNCIPFQNSQKYEKNPNPGSEKTTYIEGGNNPPCLQYKPTGIPIPSERRGNGTWQTVSSTNCTLRLEAEATATFTFNNPFNNKTCLSAWSALQAIDYARTWATSYGPISSFGWFKVSIPLNSSVKIERKYYNVTDKTKYQCMCPDRVRVRADARDAQRAIQNLLNIGACAAAVGLGATAAATFPISATVGTIGAVIVTATAIVMENDGGNMPPQRCP